MKKCIYCGGKADTKEHIPPKCLFIQRRGIQFITVPSCKSCNQSFTLDEEIFRAFLVHMTTDKSLTANALFNTKIKRSIINRPNMAKKVMEKMSLVDCYHGGIYLGKKTAIKLEDSDWQRYYNVLNKIIKGLFFNEYKKIIPLNCKIKHIICDNELTQKLLSRLNKLKWKIIESNTFAYGFDKMQDEPYSVWFTEYYKNIYFMSLVVDEQFNPEDLINKEKQ